MKENLLILLLVAIVVTLSVYQAATNGIASTLITVGISIIGTGLGLIALHYEFCSHRRQ